MDPRLKDILDSAGDDSRACAKAEAAGFTVVGSDDTTLLLDLDTEDAYIRFKAERDKLIYYGFLQNGPWQEWRSKSGNRHVMVKTVDPMTPHERVALQAIMGSDPVRERMCMVRIAAFNDNPIRLFRPAGAVVKETHGYVEPPVWDGEDDFFF